MSRTLDEMALIAGCYDLDAELRYIADSPAPEHGGFHPRVVAAARGAINVIAEARAEVAALRADAAGWERQMDMAVQRGDQLSAEVGMLEAEVAALREVAGLVREWQAAKRASTYTPKAGFTQSWLDLKVANDEREAIESRLLAATIPEVVRG